MILEKNVPLTLVENCNANGEVKTKVEVIQKEENNRCMSKIPRWVVALAISGACFILLALLAALFAVYFAPRAALYQENCEKRSCVKDFGLKCINKTCLCDTGYVYINKCVLKKNYLEKCHLTIECKDNQNMICSDGLCNCDESSYWNGTLCYPKSTFGETCFNNNQCLTKKYLYCDTKSSKCLCNNITRFWDSASCFLKKTFNETCGTASNCRDWENLICSNSVCKCSASNYWNYGYSRCIEKLRENVTCNYDYECYEPMNCTSNNICQCDLYFYHDFSTLSCLPQQDYNGNCSVDFNCRVDKYLECRNGKCLCIPQYPYYSTGYQRCIYPKTYNELCYQYEDCNSAKNLICKVASSIYLNNNCSCPLNVASGNCDCIRAYGSEYYWNGWTCTPALSYNQTCTNSSYTYTCQTMTQGTTCSGTYPFKCRCTSMQYFNFHDNRCEDLIGNTITTCSQPDACRSDLGLSCQGFLCQCNASIQFWTGSMCIDFFNYDQGICSASNQCKSGLVCVLAGVTSCSCGITIPNGYCDCPARAYGSEYYWNGFGCVMAANYGQKCYSANYTCQTLTQGTQCDASSGTCTCGPYKKWDDITQNCTTCTPPWVYYLGSCFAISAPASTPAYTDWANSIAVPNNVGTYCYNQAGAKIGNGSIIKSAFNANIFIPLNGFTGGHIYYSSSCTDNFCASCISCTTCKMLVPGNPASLMTHQCNHGHNFICEYIL